MTVREKLVVGIIFCLILDLKLFGAQVGNLAKGTDSGVGDIESGEGRRERVGSELRRRTRSSSGRGDSKGSESEIEITPPSRAIPKLRDLLPSAADIHEELVVNALSLRTGTATSYDRLNNLVEKFIDPRARKHFPVLIPYGIAGGSSFAIYAVQTKQLAALKILAQVEDFNMPDRIDRTPISVALGLARKDASYSTVVAALKELHKAKVASDDH